MTADEQLIISKLGACKLLPGTWNKRFILGITTKLNENKDIELTPSQKEWMYRCLYTYRRQLPQTYNKFKHVPECAPINKSAS